MHGWLAIATRRSVVTRALKTSALVGTILVAINQGDRLLGGDIDADLLMRIVLTFAVPYLVSTSASVGAIRDHSPTERAD